MAEFGKLPNGDVDKLEQAATAWRTFSNHDIIANAGARVAAIAGLLEPMPDENLAPIREHIESVRKAADDLRTASLALATPVSEYHAATVAVRGDIESAVTSAKWAVGLTVAAAAAAFFFTLGGSAAAGAGGVTAIVANTANTIRDVYQASNLIRAVGLAVAAAGAVGVVKAFDGVPSLTEMTSGLASIIAMHVLTDDEDGGAGNSATPDGFKLPREVVADRIVEYAGDRSIPGVPDADLPEYVEDIMGGPGYQLRTLPAETLEWPGGTTKPARWQSERAMAEHTSSPARDTSTSRDCSMNRSRGLPLPAELTAELWSSLDPDELAYVAQIDIARLELERSRLPQGRRDRLQSPVYSVEKRFRTWERLIQRMENNAGHYLIDEYVDDLISRSTLAEVLSSAPAVTRHKLESALRRLDARFHAVTTGDGGAEFARWHKIRPPSVPVALWERRPITPLWSD
ncbi:hypothetical protein [Nocardia jiangsuensis]|uniref:Uncharacterized protein n=1 Tax=Nocardia jiangsuensis TaxID=1691563 RepID=A0ABV8DR79_9NOCA